MAAGTIAGSVGEQLLALTPRWDVCFNGDDKIVHCLLLQDFTWPELDCKRPEDHSDDLIPRSKSLAVASSSWTRLVRVVDLQELPTY